MKRYIIMLVAALASLCAAAGEPFYKNIYADFTMSFSRDWKHQFISAGRSGIHSIWQDEESRNTRQYTLGIGYIISPKWNMGISFMFDSEREDVHSLIRDNINVVTTIYGEYSYLKWSRLSLTGIGKASVISFQEPSQNRAIGEVGLSLGAEFRIVRQLQLIVRYGFFGFGIGNRDFYNRYYWDQHFHPGCYSNDRSGLTADFGIRRLQFGIRVNL